MLNRKSKLSNNGYGQRVYDLVDGGTPHGAVVAYPLLAGLPSGKEQKKNQCIQSFATAYFSPAISDSSAIISASGKTNGLGLITGAFPFIMTAPPTGHLISTCWECQEGPAYPGPAVRGACTATQGSSTGCVRWVGPGGWVQGPEIDL